MAKKNDKRIQIPRSSEINELYDLPNFNHSDRENYFSLDSNGGVVHVLIVKTILKL